VGFDWVKQEGKPFHYFSYGVSVAEVDAPSLLLKPRVE
jgi:xanthine dehydrogenase molybdopterin-binding subunit B